MLSCPDDVLLYILAMLSTRDVLVMRAVTLWRSPSVSSSSDSFTSHQTSWKVCDLTRDKYLWVVMLKNIMRDHHLLLPSYIKAIDTLSSTHLEALTRRTTLSVPFWKRPMEIIFDDIPMGRVVRSDLPRSITWLRLVHDRWLLVAASDTVSSSLTCWDLSNLMGADHRPFAECYLPGPVQSGQIDIDCTSGLVVALAVSSNP